MSTDARGAVVALQFALEEGPGVFEVVEDYRADTYPAVYTVKFDSGIYVLHAFQKKSPSGIRTARKNVELIARRLNEARTDHEARYGKGNEYTQGDAQFGQCLRRPRHP